MFRVAFLVLSLKLFSCSSGFFVHGNEGGSEPVNQHEAYDYQNAINRCHRTGGTRVVKVMGELRCY